MTDHEMIININVVTHKETGLMVATSPELRGLIVHGRTVRELNERIPQGIRSLLEADGVTVTDIVSADPDDKVPDGFVPTVRRFQAIAA